MGSVFFSAPAGAAASNGADDPRFTVSTGDPDINAKLTAMNDGGSFKRDNLAVIEEDQREAYEAEAMSGTDAGNANASTETRNGKKGHGKSRLGGRKGKDADYQQPSARAQARHDAGQAQYNAERFDDDTQTQAETERKEYLKWRAQ